MKLRQSLFCAVLLVVLALATGESTVAAHADEAPVLDVKDGWFEHLVDADFVAQYAVQPKPDGVLIIDARATERRFDPGHIPTAINLPEKEFNKFADRLPQDKAMLLIFYCDGFECMLSHNAAFKAEDRGYTNIKVYADGYPGWIKSGRRVAVSIPFLKKVLDQGSPLVLIDSRPKERQYAQGHIPGAISLPDADFDKMIDRLPADRDTPLYFYCAGSASRLSADSAAKAAKLGYTQIRLVSGGYPAWVSLYGPGPKAIEGSKAMNRSLAGALAGTPDSASGSDSP